MRRRKDRYIGTEHAARANGDGSAVENGEVEVCVEARTERDVAAVVDVEGGLDEDFVVAYVADDFLEHFQALGGEDIEALGRVGGFGGWEPGVVFVGEGAGFVAGGVEVGGEGIVAGGISSGFDYLYGFWVEGMKCMISVDGVDV